MDSTLKKSDLSILVVARDIFFTSKIRAVTCALGGECLVVRESEKLARILTDAAPSHVLIDLNGSETDPFTCIEMVQSQSKATLICFFSHVDVDLAQRASSMGVTFVMPRSQFVARLPELLGGPGAGAI